MSAERMTIEVLSSGQPRPYADSHTHVRVMLEEKPDGYDWRPWDMSEVNIRKRLLAYRTYSRFTEFTYPPEGREPTPSDFFTTRLDWFRRIDAGVWEFHTTSAFTD